MARGSARKGSMSKSVKSQKLKYPPSIINSPWATLRIFVTPKTKAMPTAAIARFAFPIGSWDELPAARAEQVHVWRPREVA